MGTPIAQHNAAAAAHAVPSVGNRNTVATGRRALYGLLAMSGLLAARSPCAAETGAAPAAATQAPLYAVRERDLFGLIDAQGHVVLTPECNEVIRGQPLSPMPALGNDARGRARMRIAGKYGCIDKHGRTVIEPQFRFARPFNCGLAYVGAGRSSSYIKPDGQAARPAKHSEHGGADGVIPGIN
jgi:hypothetical protein